MDWIVAYLISLALRLGNLVWQTMISWGLERLAPRSSLSTRRQIRAVGFVLLSLPIAVLIALGLQRAFVLTHLKPLVIARDLPWLGEHQTVLTVGSVAVSILLTDLAYYWAHRAQHAIPLLWRFHSMHHSIRDLSALNNYSHWTEEAVQFLLKSLPVALLIRLSPGTAGIIAASLITLHQAYIHSASRVNFGRWSWLLNDNVRHRIHHSIEPHHFNKNFGIDFGFWDHLFGTAYVPARDEWPETGLGNQAEPQSVREFLTWSFLPRERLRDAGDPGRRGERLDQVPRAGGLVEHLDG